MRAGLIRNRGCGLMQAAEPSFDVRGDRRRSCPPRQPDPETRGCLKSLASRIQATGSANA